LFMDITASRFDSSDGRRFCLLHQRRVELRTPGLVGRRLSSGANFFNVGRSTATLSDVPRASKRWLSRAAALSAIIVVATPLLVDGWESRGGSHGRRPGESFEVAATIFAVECGGVILAAWILAELKRAAAETPDAKDLSWARFFAKAAFWLGLLIALATAAVAAMFFFVSLGMSS
jgi:hypothetical protein